MDAQDIDLVIWDFDHDTLDTPRNGITKALVTLGMKNPLSAQGKLDTAMQFNTWADCARRTWCKSNFVEALPTDLKSLIKSTTRTYAHRNAADDVLSGETVFIPNVKEIINNTSYGNIGSQYAYLVDYDHRKYNIFTTSLASGGGNQAYVARYNINGSISGEWASYNYGLLFAMCI